MWQKLYGVWFSVRYSVLPVWAKKELEGVDAGTVREVTPPRGRWAQRVDSSSFSYKSYQSETYLSLSPPVSKYMFYIPLQIFF